MYLYYNLYVEEGSKLIATFLENGLFKYESVPENSSLPQFRECSRGTLLLITLGKLSFNGNLLECMSAAGIPSTLVKCLYIFLDLPSTYVDEINRDRLQLQMKFTHVNYFSLLALFFPLLLCSCYNKFVSRLSPLKSWFTRTPSVIFSVLP